MTVTFSDDGDSDVNWSGMTLSGDVLTFTPLNWNVAQTVTLTAAEDDDSADDTEIITLTASTSGGYNGETAEITVTITDNDSPGITVQSIVSLTEGNTRPVEVKLAVMPTDDVTVTFSDDGDSDVNWSGMTLSGDVLTFTPLNWNVAQTVTLTAAEDDDSADDTEIITLTASTSGGYNGETAEITVTITDNDSPGITVQSIVSLTEGNTSPVEVKLAVMPTDDVTVTFSDDGDSDVNWSGMTLSGDVLTFTPLNWNVAQTVTLTAAEDDDSADDTEIITLTASTSGGYNGETAEITVTITDNDSPGITVQSIVSLTEGNTSPVEVKLAVMPTDDVTVTFSDDGDSDVNWSGATLSGDTLTFTPSNWSVAQAVTLMAGQDDDFVNDTETLTLTASKGGGYNGETAEVTVTIDDDDAPGITAPTMVTLTEGNTTTVEVELGAAPTGDVMVIFSDDGDSNVNWSGATLSGDTLTFTTRNWNVAQTVTLTAEENDDFMDETEILALTASGGGYTATHEITVTIMNNVGVNISESDIVQEVTLLGNYPNPLSDVTNIDFDLPAPAQISVVIMDLLGRVVRSLSYGSLGAGRAHTIQVDTAHLASGVYRYTLKADMGEEMVQRSFSMTIVR